MKNESKNGESSDARAVSNEAARLGTTEEVGTVSTDRVVAAPTVARIVEAFAAVDVIDIDALPEDNGTAGVTVAATKEDLTVEREGGCGCGGDSK